MRRNQHDEAMPGGSPAVRRVEERTVSVEVEYADVPAELSRLLIRQALEIVAEAARATRGRRA